MSRSTTLRSAARRLLSPVTRYGDERVSGLHEHLDITVHQHRERVDAVEHRLTEVQHEVQSLRSTLDQLAGRLVVDAQTVGELGLAFRRSTERIRHELATLRARVVGDDDVPPEPTVISALAGAEAELAPEAADRALAAHVGRPVAELGPGARHFLNWAGGHLGPAAQAGVWFNPPVSVEHTGGDLRPGSVNERIVEVPFALATAATLPSGSFVLDVGCAESTLPLSMASLGLEVLAADLRPYPLEHPLLTPVTGPLEDWKGPDRPLDAVFCISSIEHFGLGAYGEEGARSDLDRRTLEAVRSWLRPDGVLVFTAPYGEWSVDELQRVYDDPHLDALLEGWTVVERRHAVQTSPTTWETVASPTDAQRRGRAVVMLRATPAP